jgi:hypothetical protein
VCITFLPTNSRVEAQGFGRASRQGQIGSGQMIVNKSDVLRKLRLDPKSEVNSEQLKMIRDITQESHIKNIRENEVDRLTTNDDLFASYSKFYHSLKSQENATHKLRQVEELWGIKLKQIEKNYKTSTQDNITKRQESFAIFENFSSQVSDAYSANTIMKNPAYLLLHGYNKMGNGGDYKEAIKIMESAANLDEIYNFAVNYQLAYARLRQGYKEAAQKGSGKEKYIAYKTEVYANLANAKASIDQAIIPSLQGLQINQDANETPLLKQIQTKIQLYQLISSNIASAMRTIENGAEYEAMKINGPQKTLKDYFENKVFAQKEISELSSFGMFTIYDVNFDTLDSEARFNEMATFFLSGVQFVVGAALCATGSPWIGATLISESISDLRNVANGNAYSQNFSWDKYLTDKAITAGIMIMTAGLEKTFAAAKASRAASIANGKAIVQTGIKEVAKQSTKKIIVETIISTSLNIVLTEAANKVAKTAIKDNTSDLIDKTSQKLRNKINSSPNLERLNQIMSFDAIMNNAARMNLLQSSIAEISQTKRNLFNQISSGLSSSMMSSKNATVSTIGIISKTVEVGNNLNQVLELVDEFVYMVESKINISKDKIPALEVILQTKLSPNISSTNDINNLLSILTNAGIHKDGEFVESKINYLPPTNSEAQNTGTSPLPLRELSQSNIDTIDLGKFTPHKTKIKDVIHLIHKSRKADYSQRREALVEFCTSSLENGFNSKLRGGVIMQIANPAIRNLSSSISSTVVEGITNLFDDTQGQRYTASGDSDESIVGKIQLAVHRLFTKKQSVAEEVVEEEVVAEGGVEESMLSLSSEGGGLRLMQMQPQMQIAVRQSNNTEPSFISPMEPLTQLATDFRGTYANPAILYAFAGEFINYAFTNLGIAITKIPNSGYVIDFVAPVGKAIGSGIDSIKGVGASGIRFVIGEEKFNEILNDFHNSPRGIRFLVNDLVDYGIFAGVGKFAKVGVKAGAKVGGKIRVGANSVELVNSTALAEIRAIINNDNRIGFVGRSGFELKNFPTQKTRNTSQRIMDVDFSAHAIDQMQNRGVIPSVVISALKNGKTFPGTKPKTIGLYDEINKIQVIINSDNGRVITVIKGKPNALK